MDHYHIAHVDREAGRHHEVVDSETGGVVFAGSMADALALRAELNEVAESREETVIPGQP
jgi:hypothetical protein